MRRISLLSFILISCVVLAGCSKALLFNNGLYSHTIEPFTFNREPTEVMNEKTARGSITQFQYPVTAVVSVRVGKNGLGEVAKEHGIKTIYYADRERWSIAFGLWSKEIVHIYGR